jgi:small GTP-binding protein
VAGEAKAPGWAKNIAGQKTLKLVLTGDTAVGKSCLITNYLNNSFTEDYEPTVLDVYRGIKNVQKKQIEIEIHDTSGDEHLGVNRKVQYKDADAFMICVAANNQESLESALRWRAEI